MDNKWIFFLILGVCLIAIVLIGSSLKSELAPLEDHSIIRNLGHLVPKEHTLTIPRMILLAVFLKTSDG